jgi:hypothetical protein
VGTTTVTCTARSLLWSTATISFKVTVTGVQLFPPDD